MVTHTIVCSVGSHIPNGSPTSKNKFAQSLLTISSKFVERINSHQIENLTFIAKEDVKLAQQNLTDSETYNFARVHLTCDLKDSDINTDFLINVIKSTQGLAFLVCPTASERSFNVDFNGETARLLNKAMGEISQILFEVTKSKIAITTYDSADLPSSVENVVDRSFADSTYTILGKALAPVGLATYLAGKAYVIRNTDEYLAWAATKHPFSGSSYEPKEDGGYNRDEYFRAMKELIPKINLK